MCACVFHVSHKIPSSFRWWYQQKSNFLVTGLWSDVVANDDDDGDNSNSNIIAIVYATRLSFKAIRCRYSIEWFIALLVKYTQWKYRKWLGYTWDRWYVVTMYFTSKYYLYGLDGILCNSIFTFLPQIATTYSAQTDNILVESFFLLSNDDLYDTIKRFTTMYKKKVSLKSIDELRRSLWFNCDNNPTIPWLIEYIGNVFHCLDLRYA